MPNAAHRRRVQALATGAIAMVAAATQAMPAQADDTQHNSNHNSKTLSNAHPSWATPDKDRGAVPASQTITTRVFLTGQDDAALAAFARDVNDPNSPNYGQFLTADQVKQQFGATPAQIAAVQQWLKDAGLSVSQVSTNWIDAKGDAAAVQRAFGTQLKNYQRPDGTIGYAASSAAVVPGAVAGYVAGVAGLSQTANRAHNNSVKTPGATPNAAAQNGDQCGNYWGQGTVSGYPAGSTGGAAQLLPCPYSAQDLRSAYGLTKTGKGATIAVVDWYASPHMADIINDWASKNGAPALRSGQYKEYYNQSAWNSSNVCGDPSGEEALDVEMAHGLAPDANIVYVGANSCNDNDLMAAEQQIVDQHLADVVSNSWGALTHTKGGDEDPAIMAQYDRIFQQGAAEGISFTFSTGDCGDDDPANKAGGAVNCGDNSSRKQTEWPVSSQWVTAVGGTTLATNSSGGYAWEVAMGDHQAKANSGDSAWRPGVGNIPFFFGGGGGTSEDITQPWYQTGKVPANLANTTSAGAPATRPMRVIPDVAMNGSLATSVQVEYWDAEHGRVIPTGMGGTSVAAPEFAAVLADAKEAAGHAIGFANPSLYALNGSAFHDVNARPGTTEGVIAYGGSNKGYLYQVGQDTSLRATAGYDNATGLGSPNSGFVAALAAQKPPAAGNPAGPAVSRVSGATRYETAIAVSKQAFPQNGSAPAVVLATGENFPDALAGVPFAKQKNAPLLLTPSKGLDAGVAAEIKRVLAPGGKVYVLGGEKAVTPAVLAALKLPAGQIQRIAGDTRYSTSVAIAQAMGSPKNVVVATGTKFPDALAAGPYASDVFSGRGTGPAAIILTEDTVVPQPMYDYFKRTGVTDLAAVGGQAVTAVSSWGPTLVKFKGNDRFETAAQVAKAFPYPQIAGVATGTQFADALTGAALLARSNSPLLLTMPNALPDATRGALQGLAHSLAGGGWVDIFGGPAAVSNTVVGQVATAVGGRVK